MPRQASLPLSQSFPGAHPLPHVSQSLPQALLLGNPMGPYLAVGLLDHKLPHHGRAYWKHTFLSPTRPPADLLNQKLEWDLVIYILASPPKHSVQLGSENAAGLQPTSSSTNDEFKALGGNHMLLIAKPHHGLWKTISGGIEMGSILLLLK